MKRELVCREQSYSNFASGFGMSVPVVLITFDDGKASDYTEAFAYMQAKGMAGTSYVNSSTINTAGYLTESQLIEMDAAGWDIGSHTALHSQLAGQTQAAQELQIADCKTYLDGLGLTRASGHVAYPFGSYDANTLLAMTAQAAPTGRTVSAHMGQLSNYATYWHELPGQRVNTTVTLAQAKSFIDDCICRGVVSILYLHGLAASPAYEGWTISDFRALVDYIYSKKLVSLTISQLYALHIAPLIYTNPWYTE